MVPVCSCSRHTGSNVAAGVAAPPMLSALLLLVLASLPTPAAAGVTSESWFIPAVAGGGGGLVLGIVLLALCCRRRKMNRFGRNDRLGSHAEKTQSEATSASASASRGNNTKRNRRGGKGNGPAKLGSHMMELGPVQGSDNMGNGASATETAPAAPAAATTTSSSSPPSSSSSDPTAAADSGRSKFITINKRSPADLGFCIDGGEVLGHGRLATPITIGSVALQSDAYRGGMREGDLLVNIDGTSTYGVTYSEALDMLIDSSERLNVLVQTPAPEQAGEVDMAKARLASAALTADGSGLPANLDHADAAANMFNEETLRMRRLSSITDPATSPAAVLSAADSATTPRGAAGLAGGPATSTPAAAAPSSVISRASSAAYFTPHGSRHSILLATPGESDTDGEFYTPSATPRQSNGSVVTWTTPEEPKPSPLGGTDDDDHEIVVRIREAETGRVFLMDVTAETTVEDVKAYCAERVSLAPDEQVLLDDSSSPLLTGRLRDFASVVGGAVLHLLSKDLADSQC